MNQKILHFALTVTFSCAGLNAMAQNSWEMPADPFETGIAPTNGAKVMLYNVEAGGVMGMGKISANWATSAILYSIEEEASKAITYELEESDGKWSLKSVNGSHVGKYTFTPSAENDRPYLFVDMAGDWQGSRKLTVEELPDGGYSLAFDNEELAPEGTYMGTNGETMDVICNANPDEGGLIVWNFIPADAVSIYTVRCEMYEKLYEAEEYPSIKLDDYSAVYNNSEATLDELNASLTALKAAVLDAQMNSGGYDPSPTDPLDLTEGLLQNPTFDDGVNGWTNIGGMGHDPNGTVYNGASYTAYEAGEEVDATSQLSSFCEKWTGAGGKLGNEYGISQSVSLPEGLYRLEADAIACQQADGSIQVSGVTLYVKTDTKYEVGVATANNSPKHYVIEFLADGKTPVEVGFHVDATTEANWVAVDNFKIYNIGKSTMSAAALQLQNAIKAADSKFPEDEFDVIEAKASVKDSYVTTLTEVQGVLAKEGATDEEYSAAVTKLNDAVAALSESKSAYATMRNAVSSLEGLAGALLEIDDDGEMESTCSAIAEEISTTIEDAAIDNAEAIALAAISNTYNDLYKVFEYTAERKEALADDETVVGMIEAEENALRDAWKNRTYKTTAEVAAAKDKIATMIANYLNAAIKPETDLTSMLINPNFDENSNGWDYEYEGKNVTPGYNYSEIEYFQKSFNVRQTLKAMPKGRYTLTVQGYQRRNDGVNAVLYANGNEIKLWEVRDKANDTGYFPGEGTGAYPNDSYNSELGIYYPNSMEGARQWFDQFEEDGETPLYTNVLDFYLTDAESQDLTIGVKSDNNSDWCLFDNFTLYYHGNRAKDYADGLNDLIEELNTTMEEGYVTVALTNTADAAKKKATDAISANDANACIAAIPVLKNAISEAKTVLALTKNLADKYGFIVGERISDVKSSDAKTAYEAYLSGVSTSLEKGTIKDNDEVATIADEMETKFTEMVQAPGLATATEDKPYDITAAIVNPSYECNYALEAELASSEYNAFGWEGDTPSCNEYSAEFWAAEWSAGKDVHQTIKGLAPGWYKLHVFGYNRQGYGNDHVDAPVSSATLYAGEFSTPLHDVLSSTHEDKSFFPDEEGQNVSVYVTEAGDSLYYPGNMPSSRVCFDEGEYYNTLNFQVKEGQKEVTIGISKTTYSYWDSLMFDDWSLEYVGTSEPTTPSTAVANVTLGEVVSTKIYNVNGVEIPGLVKGINIVKKADADGNVKVSKVLVK